MTRAWMLGVALFAGACSGGGSPDVVTVTMAQFTVPAGGETYKCQNFANPFHGTVDVDSFQAHMPVGVHHMIVFFVDGVTDGPLEDCSGSEFHANVFAAQSADSRMDFPPGVGVAIPATTGLRLQLHFVNATQGAVTAGVTSKFHVAAPGAVTEHAGQMLFSNENIVIPPSTSATPTAISKTCPVPKMVSLIGASAHMHQHAVSFVAKSGDQLLYQTAGGKDAVPSRFDPPIVLQAMQPVTFTCSYVNDTGTNIVFGESAVTDEMCIFGGIYYPVDDVNAPNITCF